MAFPTKLVSPALQRVSSYAYPLEEKSVSKDFATSRLSRYISSSQNLQERTSSASRCLQTPTATFAEPKKTPYGSLLALVRLGSLNEVLLWISLKKEVTEMEWGSVLIEALGFPDLGIFDALVVLNKLIWEEHRPILIEKAARRQCWESVLLLLKNNKPLFSLSDNEKIEMLPDAKKNSEKQIKYEAQQEKCVRIALFRALLLNHVDFVNSLREQGEIISQNVQRYLLCEAAYHGRKAFVTALFVKEDVLTDPLLGRALCIAAGRGHEAFIRALLFRAEAASPESLTKALEVAKGDRIKLLLTAYQARKWHLP
jgi:hypothetical protein